MHNKSTFLFGCISLIAITMLYGMSAVQATGDNYTITGATSTYAQIGVPMAITDVQIDQFAGDASSTVPVSLVVTNGTLSLGTTSGLTFTGAETGDTLRFTGTRSAVNAALQTLTYTRNSVGTDTLEISLVDPGEEFLEETGHLYQFIAGDISWTAAQTAATGLTRYGATGYLATVLSSAENEFIAARVSGDGWIGASDALVEGTWQWSTGPESGTSFWSGEAAGSPILDRYSNWNPGEPNQSGNEDCAQLYISDGQWNDLSCDQIIDGYIVEFGGGGDDPNIAARNITITTINAPVVETFSPAGNATGVVVDPELVITFDVPVVTSTGALQIKLASDDSIVESISATSSQISGSGTDTITISPSVELLEQTSYYITIDETLFTTTSSIGYAGISNSSTWNFTTGDFTPPVFSSITSTAGITTSTISWTTDEIASSRVWYGVGVVYSTSTVMLDTDPRVLSHSVVLSGLLPCTSYVYLVDSIDGSTNQSTSTYQSFQTLGCITTEVPSATTSTPVTVDTGATSTLPTTLGGPTIQVYIPPNVTTSSDTLVIQIQALPKIPVYAMTGLPTGPDNSVGTFVFDVKAIINGTTILDSFDIPVTITYSYTDEEIAGLDESSLRIYHYSNSSWSVLDDCSVDRANNTVQCTTQSFSIFGIFGDELVVSSGGGAYIPPSTPVFTNTDATPMQGVIEINNNDTETSKRDVTISVYASNVASIALSESIDFTTASYVPFAGGEIPFTLSTGYGPKTLYAKLRSTEGGVVTVQDSIVLTGAAIQPIPATPINPDQALQCTSNVYLTNAVGPNRINNAQDVRLLEEFLNTYENANLPVNGIYEQVDIAAVIAWQEKYASDILTPWGITNGTGYVFTTSLAKIKEIHEANCATAAPAPTTPVVQTTTTECLNTTDTLRIGMNNAFVVTAQRILKNLSYFPADIDTTGYFGPVTETATRAFQQANDIDQVGFIGPQTRARLNELGCRD